MSPPFRRSRISEYIEPILEPLAHELIDRFADRGTADLVAEFTTRYRCSYQPIARSAVEDEATVHRWAHDLFYFPMDPPAAMRASEEFTDHVMPILAERRRNPGDDLISMLVTESAEGETLDDEQILAFLRLLFPAGADTPCSLSETRCPRCSPIPTRWTCCARIRPSTRSGRSGRACVGNRRWGCSPRLPEATTWNGIEIPPLTPMIFSINAALRDPAVTRIRTASTSPAAPPRCSRSAGPTQLRR